MESDDGYYSGNPSLISLEQSLDQQSKRLDTDIPLHQDFDSSPISSFHPDPMSLTMEKGNDPVEGASSTNVIQGHVAQESQEMHDMLPSYEVPASQEVIPLHESIPSNEATPLHEPIPSHEMIASQEAIPLNEVLATHEATPSHDVLDTYEATPSQEVLPPHEVIPSHEMLSSQEVIASQEVHDFHDVHSVQGSTDVEDQSITDNDHTDVDSAYDNASLIGDDTKSLASSIVDYRVEHGRRYHAYKDGAYWGPNDEPASDIQDLAHHIYLLTLDNKLFLAPLRDVQNVLDIGTGTGIWAIDVADTFPSAAVIGVDLSPIQPSFVPPNCTFEVDDVTLDWTWPEDHFDFIHIREMFGSIPDWDTFFEQCFRCTRRGGWVEIVEHSVEPICDDETQPPEHFYWEWGNKVVELGNKIGKSFTIWKEAKERLERAGFVDVVEVTYKWPMNAWSNDVKQREIGRWNQLRLYNGVEGFMLRLLTGPGELSYERAQVFLSQMRASLRDYSCHSYLPGTVVYGRKP